MEAAPPSYETATLVNPWDLVAEWLPSNDLCSAALVSSSWHTIFTPHLWGNPAAHFGTENDRVYVALTKFQRTLPWTRKFVRAFAHTLHLPPASAQIYYGPHDGWLRDVLDRLENLQTLIVRGLPFFDHGALTALRLKPNADNSLVISQSFQLRFLDASKCENATPTGLLAALKRLDQLLYLDLSYTYTAKDRQVLAQLSNFAGLQVLKLRGLALKDEDVQLLAKAIGSRVRSLDLRDNKITDQAVRYLTESCFTTEHNDVEAAQRRADGERASLLHYLGPKMLRIYQGEGFEGYLRRSLSSRFVARLAFEDTPESGITHLYVANNQLSVEGLSGLLRTRRLHVLDAGVDNRPPNKLIRDQSAFNIVYPGAEKLPLTLSKQYGDNLTYLKIDHEIITKKPPDYHPETSVPGRVELADTSAVVESSPGLPPRHFELDSTAIPAVELPADNAISELPGSDPNVPLPLRTVAKHDSSNQDSIPPEPTAKRGSIFAPEPVSAWSEAPSSSYPTENSTMSSISALSNTTTPQGPHPHSSTLSPALPSVSPSMTLQSPPTPKRPRSYSALQATRSTRVLDPTQYHPSTTPHLHTLTLTHFPSHSPTRTPIDRLITFLRLCAAESHLATHLAEADYSLPPGRRSASHRREAARKLFALETVVLEVVPTGPTGAKGAAKGAQKGGWKGKSMTDDRDGDALWRTAEGDFSFFTEEGEELWPSIEDPGRGVGEGLEVVVQGMGREEKGGGDGMRMGRGKEEGKKTEEWVDNIAVLAAWRRERKGEWERVKGLHGEEGEVEVEGYWPGTVRVVRLSGLDDEAEEGEERDYYGNLVGKGGIYR
ncbi:hypothetical protein C1H76_6234 [Elsinoe australis]|uniref:F-box domain-containing protein n=1 Tax=Elsinoe australis TaxID=40998 RepID=A0A4U7ATN9_9PEZI|nr:hypothetical protein C1H76_6234 [Elsinoe australis]